MAELDNNKNQLREIFPHQDALSPTDNIGDRYAFEQCYATASEEIIKRFKLILSTGEIISIPYSLLPIITLRGNSIITIIAYELLVTIKGRSLDIIEELLSSEVILWIKETPSKKDDEQSEVFISEITITGKAFNK